jgi:hypothetical protein
MEARCRLFGHVRDSTEFEERREQRPNGTVLICREYQVCRRCGDREELYRNEQILTAETVEADSHAAETVDNTASDGNGSETRRVDEHDGQETAPASTEEADDAVIISDSTTDADPSAGETRREARTDGTGDSLATPHESGSPTLSFDAGDDDSEQIRCGSCGREWQRDDTSLREGDLCPGCREAYVEGA